jgi:hypothetical protein
VLLNLTYLAMAAFVAWGRFGPAPSLADQALRSRPARCDAHVREPRVEALAIDRKSWTLISNGGEAKCQ